jgi:hypothetical protein
MRLIAKGYVPIKPTVTGFVEFRDEALMIVWAGERLDRLP